MAAANVHALQLEVELLDSNRNGPLLPAVEQNDVAELTAIVFTIHDLMPAS